MAIPFFAQQAGWRRPESTSRNEKLAAPEQNRPGACAPGGFRCGTIALEREASRKLQNSLQGRGW